MKDLKKDLSILMDKEQDPDLFYYYIKECIDKLDKIPTLTFSKDNTSLAIELLPNETKKQILKLIS